MLNDLVAERLRIERYWDARSKEGELHLAIFVYAARCLAEGDIEALRQIGFVADDIPVLEQLRMSDLQALAASRAHALNVQIDRDALQRSLTTTYRRRTRERLRRELVQLDAPLSMMATLFGMTPREYSALRERIGVSSGVGRPKTQLDEEPAAAIWQLWVELADAAHPDKLRHDDLWLVIGRALSSPLREAWFAVQRWSSDPVTVQAFVTERIQRSEAEIGAAEATLRAAHGVSPIDIVEQPFSLRPDRDRG
jgi:hypothetical protein